MMLRASGDYSIIELRRKKIQAGSGDMTAGSILLKPVLSPCSEVLNSRPNGSFQDLVEVNLAIHRSFEPDNG
jgi:hypothetical protein